MTTARIRHPAENLDHLRVARSTKFSEGERQIRWTYKQHVHPRSGRYFVKVGQYFGLLDLHNQVTFTVRFSEVLWHRQSSKIRLGTNTVDSSFAQRGKLHR